MEQAHRDAAVMSFFFFLGNPRLGLITHFVVLNSVKLQIELYKLRWLALWLEMNTPRHCDSVGV